MVFLAILCYSEDRRESFTMNITSFNPIYGTTNPDEAEAFFGEMGFKVIHRFAKEGFEIRTLENESGLLLDIMDSDFVREAKISGYFACRLNVDDLQEAIDFFTKKGGEQLTPIIQEAGSRELVNIRTKNGDMYSVIHHIK